MSSKFFFILCLIAAVLGLVFYEDFSQNFTLAVAIGICLLAITAWFVIITKRSNEKKASIPLKKAELEDDDGEYHNDFSKVPGGVADPFQPPPRSIGYGYGDGGKSLDEDMERIGLVNNDDEKVLV